VATSNVAFDAIVANDTTQLLCFKQNKTKQHIALAANDFYSNLFKVAKG